MTLSRGCGTATSAICFRYQTLKKLWKARKLNYVKISMVVRPGSNGHERRRKDRRMNESKQGHEDEKTGECCISRAWNPLMALIAVKTSKEGKEKKRNRAQEATMTMASNTLNERSVRELKHVRASLKKIDQGKCWSRRILYSRLSFTGASRRIGVAKVYEEENSARSRT